MQLADVDREVAEMTRRQFGGVPPLTMEEALRRVDAQAQPGPAHRRHGSSSSNSTTTRNQRSVKKEGALHTVTSSTPGPVVTEAGPATDDVM